MEDLEKFINEELSYVKENWTKDDLSKGFILALEKIKNKFFIESNTTSNIILTKETGELIKRLSQHFLGDMFQGIEYKKYNEACNNDLFMASCLFIFLQMFPSSDPDKNKHWNQHFQTTWDNVTLRRLTPMTLRNFKKIYKSKDIGLFLIGTYIFIQQSFNTKSDKYFIKNLENYFKEYKYWYDQAEEMLKSGKLDYIVKKKENKSTTNITII